MATNKNAVLRYKVLDRCFQNSGRKYYLKDLLDTVNDALIENNPESNGIKERQLREDMLFMESEAGYSSPITKGKDGRKVYFYYEDRTFSINQSPINITELEQLASAISVMERISGAPQFEWIEGIKTLLKDKFDLKQHDQPVISFESNIDYTGYDKIAVLFDAITNKQVLRVEYKPFNKDTFTLTFHPHHLSQYNNRWFALGLNEELKVETWNLALDRIQNIEVIDTQYQKCNIDWEDRLSDVIGVSIDTDREIEEVVLKFSPIQADYITTKPLHPTQKHRVDESGNLIVSIKVIPNYELTAKILSYGDNVEIIEPQLLRVEVSARISLANSQYY